MSVRRNAAFDYASQFGILALSTVAGILISRKFDEEGKGAYIAVTLAVTLGTNFTSLGMRSANQYSVGKNNDQAGAAHGATILMAALSTALAFLFVSLAPNAWTHKLLAGFEEKDRRLLVWAAAVLPLSLYAFGWAGILVGLGRIRALANYNLGFQFAQVAATLAALAFGNGLAAVLGAWTLAWAAGAVGMLWMLRDHKPRFGAAPAYLRRALSFGARSFAGNVAGNLMLHYNKIAIATFGGTGALGLYGTADGYANKFFMHNDSLERGAFAQMASRNRDDAARLSCRLARNSLAFGLIVWAIGGTISSGLLLLNGPQFAKAIGPLWIIMAAAWIMGGTRMIAMFITGQLGKPHICAMLDWVAVAITIPMVYYFSKHGGLAGAAAGAALGYTLHFTLFLSVFYSHMRRAGLGLGELFIPRASDFALVRDMLRRGWLRLFPSSVE